VETLSFAGGRLLLRGVNGSGKSTAMNMLLPFLLEADTRRIDAAGEQSGVLRSWMLSGRDEPQPQGYLWIEFANGEEHLAFGCGIRANRSTDRVTTWWFITAQRPGIDLALVEGRHPLSADALRAVLEPGAVYSHDQRSAYRAEVRTRLYGGVDLDQHVRLLHVVRNPRVGDRIDLDLPQYLEDALPQLSETALDDAAQPLEDLEEHRRNVEDLERTATALQAIKAVYRSYARTELHRVADEAMARVDEWTRLERAEAAAWTQQQAAAGEFHRASAALRKLQALVGRLDDDIRNLEGSDAYQAGAELNDLRDHVRSLTSQVDEAASEAGRRAAHTLRAEHALTRARGEAEAEARALGERLAELGAHAGEAGLDRRPPDAPAIATQRREGDGPTVPLGAMEVDPTRARIGMLRAAGHHRAGDIAAVRRALASAGRAESALGDAERRRLEADEDEQRAQSRFTEARHALQHAIERWRDALDRWSMALAKHRAMHQMPSVASTVDPDDVAGTAADGAGARASINQGWLDLVQLTLDEHSGSRAELEAGRSAQDQVIEDLEAHVAALMARAVPDPPTTPWQRRDGAPCLAELVDFSEELSAERRAGLEAALEAAGLLSAELAADGSLLLADGQLVAGPGAARVTDPLSDLLSVTVPEELTSAVDAGGLERVLQTISVTDKPGPGDPTVVTASGQFRTGILRGRHTKAEAEYIGMTARRAALERQRAKAHRELREATEVRDGIETALSAARVRIAEALALRQSLPSTDDIVTATMRSDLVATELEQARARLDHRRTEHDQAERDHAELVEAAQRTASSLGLPRDLVGLDGVAATLTAITTGCDMADAAVASLARAVSRWIEQGSNWEQARTDQVLSDANLSQLREQHDHQANKLATLEDSIGADYDEVVRAIEIRRADLERAREDQRRAHETELEANTRAAESRAQHGVAVEAREHADAQCVAALPRLRATLRVPGLLAAALSLSEVDDIAPSAGPPTGVDSPEDPFPTVAETPQGVKELAASVHVVVAKPEGMVTTAEGVRQSLRRRRDALGAGWDAEDHQPDDRLPVSIEVTGPLGRLPLSDAADRVSEQLANMASLLSAKQDQALRNLLQGLVAREVAEKLHAAGELVKRMNRRLATITTSHGIGVSLRWRRRDDLEVGLTDTVDLLAKPPDLRTAEEDHELIAALSERIADARREDPEQPYRELIANVLDYRAWHRMTLILQRPGRDDERLTRRTALSEGEKKMVSYLPLFAAVAASCDALSERAPEAPRFVILDDAFAKVSEDNHAKLFGLLVELDLDFIATSERLWGTHDTVPELAITEVIRDASLGAIVLEHSRWDGRRRERR
jgi:uncharacterized protein (TIGR02680 family)